MLRHESAVKRINRVLMIDGIHTSYIDDKPRPLESKMDTEVRHPIAAIDGDLGYRRTIVRSDGRVLTAYCFNGPEGSEHAVEATCWTSPAK